MPLPVRKSVHPRGFTLVELLVVLGIITVLVAILLPTLAKARQAADTVKCGSNLHSIGQGIAAYVADYKGVLPASNTWKKLAIGPDTQTPTAPIYGTIHWSSYLYGGKASHDPTDTIYRSPQGWSAFQCPALDRGGLAPANTYAGNNDFPNEANGTDPNTGKPIIDDQAPRLAYTLNEALCPRSFFVQDATAAGAQIQRPYRFVKAGSVRNSAGTILATEIWGLPNLMAVESSVNPGSGQYVSGARRPVSGFTSGLVGPEVLWQLPGGGAFASLFPLAHASVSNLTPDPSTTSGIGGVPTTTLDWVGRNHGSRSLDNTGFDLRKSNFLYLDGHVETRHIRGTLNPFQWGEQFYSLTGGENVAPS